VNRLVALAVAAALLLGGCFLASAPSEEPLLLEEHAEPAAETTEDMADNSRCHVCHFNYSDEPLAVTHAKAGVGCETCHGESNAHCGDENNITPPDKMYPRDTINASCMACHPQSKLARHPKEHKPILPEPKTAKMVCTGCHGEHRLESRVVRWNKKTGELLPEEDPPE
jgi:hypothetical protein